MAHIHSQVCRTRSGSGLWFLQHPKFWRCDRRLEREGRLEKIAANDGEGGGFKRLDPKSFPPNPDTKGFPHSGDFCWEMGLFCQNTVDG